MRGRYFYLTLLLLIVDASVGTASETTTESQREDVAAYRAKVDFDRRLIEVLDVLYSSALPQGMSLPSISELTLGRFSLDTFRNDTESRHYWLDTKIIEKRFEFLGKLVESPANLHEYPSSESKISRQILSGDLLYVISQHGDWYAVILKNGRLGYLSADLVEVIPVGDAAPEIAGRAPSSPGSEDGSALPRSTSTSENTRQLPEQFLRGTESDVRTVVDALDSQAGDQQPKFSNSSFKCRSDLEQCRARYGYLDCELTMIACIIGSLSGS